MPRRLSFEAARPFRNTGLVEHLIACQFVDAIRTAAFRTQIAHRVFAHMTIGPGDVKRVGFDINGFGLIGDRHNVFLQCNLKFCKNAFFSLLFSYLRNF